ncbi:MAG: DUF3786 domain-containing protein [Dehalococcoidia bacterium]|nr:DUF3786 domain-containing protein [Dehalococcoidia bacterium]
MPLDPAYKKAIEDMGKISPHVAANRAGVAFDGQEFRVLFFNRLFVVRYPQVEVLEVIPADNVGPKPSVEGLFPPASGRAMQVSPGLRPVAMWLRIIVLHYIITAAGAPIADEWITFRELPGGHIYERAFVERAVQPLERAFGQDLAGFKRAAEFLGGVKMDRTGDAAYWFMAFSRLRLGCILFLSDEDLPASINILFDKAAGDCLATEDLSAVGGYLSSTLMRVASSASPADQINSRLA